MSRFRRRLMGLAALRQAKADDYILCEYIENTSTAYINTGYKNGAQSWRIDATISLTTANKGGYIIGSRGSSRYFQTIEVSSNGYFETKAHQTTVANSDYTAELNKKYHLVGTPKSLTVSYDDIDEETQETVEKSFTITNSGGLYSNGYELTIFNLRQSITAQNAFQGRLYGLKLYNASGTLIRDYIPMYQVSTNTYGLYDVLNDKFYGSGNSSKFTGSLLLIDDYLKGMCQARWADSDGRILYTTLANSEFGEEKTKLVNKLKWVQLTSTFDVSVKLYGIKTVSTQRLADCTANFNYNGTTNWLGLNIFHKRWGYQNGASSYSGIGSIWTSYGGYYYTIYLDTYSSNRNVKYMNFKNITGYRPAQYKPTMVDVLVNSDDI